MSAQSATARKIQTEGARDELCQANINEQLKSSGQKVQAGGNARLLRRLARRAPQILERYEQGEFKSVRAAAIAAGIVKVKTPLELLQAAWNKATNEERESFRKEITP